MNHTTTSTTITTVCMHCHRVLGTKPGYGVSGESHGECSPLCDTARAFYITPVRGPQAASAAQTSHPSPSTHAGAPDADCTLDPDSSGQLDASSAHGVRRGSTSTGDKEQMRLRLIAARTTCGLERAMVLLATGMFAAFALWAALRHLSG